MYGCTWVHTYILSSLFVEKACKQWHSSTNNAPVSVCSFWLQGSELLYRSDSGMSKHTLIINDLTCAPIWVLEEQQDLRMSWQLEHKKSCSGPRGLSFTLHDRLLFARSLFIWREKAGYWRHALWFLILDSRNFKIGVVFKEMSASGENSIFVHTLLAENKAW